jgi:hypothetical protein
MGMTAATIRFRLHFVRSVYRWLVLAAIAGVAWIEDWTVFSYIVAGLTVVLIVIDLIVQASLASKRARADKARVDQTSPGAAAGFTSIGLGGVVLQILITIVVDVFIILVFIGGGVAGGNVVLIVIAVVLTVYAIVLTYYTGRLRSLQRKGMAEFAAQA